MACAVCAQRIARRCTFRPAISLNPTKLVLRKVLVPPGLICEAEVLDVKCNCHGVNQQCSSSTSNGLRLAQWLREFYLQPSRWVLSACSEHDAVFDMRIELVRVSQRSEAIAERSVFAYMHIRNMTAHVAFNRVEYSVTSAACTRRGRHQGARTGWETPRPLTF